ncbi:hypothetical protein PV08_04176 [Exophiala spinifera]|uniref:Mitochondrial thiamine pyrophosphate carrier 1 n=1 Tax=Exophiala spinifera TaxID=91928 RepID=A0A0D2BEI5_9EURO|nr:uncharacterized protein PV08_04176 [Exophiala spinifera]KIW16985.1 hypothetical protein PV08_04176 [Exophiala spinifera]
MSINTADEWKAAATLQYPFWFGGSASSMAAMVTHPLDLVKVRLQTRTPNAPKTMRGTFTFILRNQGLPGLYAGISAALLRQSTYSTVRFGVYEDLKTRYAASPTPSNPRPNLPMTTLIALSSLAGLLGGIAGNPGDVLNVRMQSDASKPAELRKNYKNALAGLIHMIREEGLSSIWRGVGPNSARAVLASASQLASYDYFKSICLSLNMLDNLTTHFCASLAAGFVTTTVCSPVDVVKSRIMSSIGSQLPILQMIRDAGRKEGLLWIFRGWVPSFIRLGPQTVFTMAFFEQHKKWYRQWKGCLD